MLSSSYLLHWRQSVNITEKLRCGGQVSIANHQFIIENQLHSIYKVLTQLSQNYYLQNRGELAMTSLKTVQESFTFGQKTVSFNADQFHNKC